MYYVFVFTNKSIIQETCCSKHPLVARVEKLSAPNFHCCHFNGKAVPMGFSVGVCMQIKGLFTKLTNGAENSSS